MSMAYCSITLVCLYRAYGVLDTPIIIYLLGTLYTAQLQISLIKCFCDFHELHISLQQLTVQNLTTKTQNNNESQKSENTKIKNHRNLCMHLSNTVSRLPLQAKEPFLKVNHPQAGQLATIYKVFLTLFIVTHIEINCGFTF